MPIIRGHKRSMSNFLGATAHNRHTSHVYLYYLCTWAAQSFTQLKIKQILRFSYVHYLQPTFQMTLHH
jgi:hypothetical protein